jgi:hypothetical protein
MAHMTLPAAHSEADAQLAQRIGRALELEEVHVFWTYPAAATAPASAFSHAGPELGTVPRGGLVAALSAVLERLVPQRR